MSRTIIAAFLVSGVSAGSLASEARSPEIIAIQLPTIVAFFPLANPTKANDAPDTNEALADFQFYLKAAEGPLKHHGVDLHQVYTRAFQMRAGKQLSTFRPRKGQCGYLLIEPGKAPHVMYGVMTDSDLLEAASRYFAKLAK